MKTYGGGAVINAAKEYVAREDADPIFKAKMENLLKLVIDEAKHFHLQSLLKRAGVQVPEEE